MTDKQVTSGEFHSGIINVIYYTYTHTHTHKHTHTVSQICADTVSRISEGMHEPVAVSVVFHPTADTWH